MRRVEGLEQIIRKMRPGVGEDCDQKGVGVEPGVEWDCNKVEDSTTKWNLSDLA